MWKPALVVFDNFANVHKTLVLFQRKYASQTATSFAFEIHNVNRKSFSTINDTDVDYFKTILSQEHVITDESDIIPYNIDWFKKYQGQSKLVLRPKSTHEVSQILKYCNERRLAVCPQGGNTGVSGGSVPLFDEIILHMGLMNKIIQLDGVSGTLVCESGCVLENLETHVKEHGLIMPLDLGAKGSCHIGGNLSTNAGGLRLARYGNLHGTVLGLEAVKADGTIIDCLKTLKKDNTGYHLKHLFIGSEGTLGVITKVAIHCPVLPKSVNVAYFGVNTFEEILQVYKRAKSSLGEIISAFEMMDLDSITRVVENMNMSNPLPAYPFYVLLETHGSDSDHDREKLTRFLAGEIDAGRVIDGIVASESAKIKAIWSLRENIPAAGLQDGYLVTTDISLPIANFYQIVPAMRAKLGTRTKKIYGFGHLGDGNIHINMAFPEYDRELLSVVEKTLYDEVAALDGSVSAEHGIGISKRRFIHLCKNPSALKLMGQLKKLMDPNGILNPYKVLPETECDRLAV